jgi:hypothetical protein
MSRIAAIAAVVLVVVVTSIGVASAAYPPAAPSVGVSDSTVTAGASVTVTGDRWQGGSTVTLSFHSTVVRLGSVTTRPDGSFSTSVTIPSNASAGTHAIVASGTASNGRARTVSTAVTVLGDVVTAPGSTAFTGAHLDVWMATALLLFLAGAGLILIGRRRSRSAS